jgi:amino acid transporter
MLLYAGIAFVLFLAISVPVTVPFNQALTWLSYNPPADTTVEAYPVFMLYAGVLIDNIPVFLLVGAGLVLWSYLWLPSAQLIATRAIFAWSFDRIVPERLSEVHPKYHSPWVAILVVAVISEAFPRPVPLRRLQVPDPGACLLLRLLARIPVRRRLPVPRQDEAALEASAVNCGSAGSR